MKSLSFIIFSLLVSQCVFAQAVNYSESNIKARTERVKTTTIFYSDASNTLDKYAIGKIHYDSLSGNPYKIEQYNKDRSVVNIYKFTFSKCNNALMIKDYVVITTRNNKTDSVTKKIHQTISDAIVADTCSPAQEFYLFEAELSKPLEREFNNLDFSEYYYPNGLRYLYVFTKRDKQKAKSNIINNCIFFSMTFLENKLSQ
ncbi:MAG: hypothetical protein M0D57_09270 [Sphingobacteriales bacterium JAD_PAG50586_3]|nr:MAG: hypothetical protein M0D57_09270 [Sphingobacteriales bacterium JAD_PAG50586_3]